MRALLCLAGAAVRREETLSRAHGQGRSENGHLAASQRTYFCLSVSNSARQAFGNNSFKVVLSPLTAEFHHVLVLCWLKTILCLFTFPCRDLGLLLILMEVMLSAVKVDAVSKMSRDFY